MAGDSGDTDSFDSRDFDALARVRSDAIDLDALADGERVLDPAIGLLAALRAEVDARIGATDGAAVRRDAFLLDALATGTPLSAATDPAVALLVALRSAVDHAVFDPAGRPEVAAPVAFPVRPVTVPAAAATGTPAPGEAAAAPAAAEPAAAVATLQERRERRRRHAVRTVAAVSSLGIALSMSGVAAAAYSSHPGSSLYGIRTATWGRTDDDPVYAQDLLQQATQELQAAQADPAAAGTDLEQSRKKLARVQQIIRLEHNPVAQQSIQASASHLSVAIAAQPTPSAAAPAVSVAGRRPGSSTTAVPTHSHGAPVGVVPGSSAVPVEPVPSTTVSASPSPVLGPTPEPSGSVTGSPEPVASGTGTPTGAPSGTPTATGSGTPTTATPTPTGTDASPTTTPSSSSTPSRPVAASSHAAPTITPIRVTQTRVKPKPKPKPRKKHPTTATLMTATLSATTNR